MNTTNLIPAAQLAPARALALAYGHEWACALAAAEAEGRALPAMTPEASAAWVVANRHPGSMAGIDCPTLDEYGNITHTTGSGRLTWYTTPDGMTSIAVNRPGVDAVLCACVYPTGHLGPEAPVQVWPGEGNEPYYQRHVAALNDALTVLVGAGPAAEATEYLRNDAVDHRLTPDQARLTEDVLYIAHAVQERGAWALPDLRMVVRLLSRAFAVDKDTLPSLDPADDVVLDPEVSRDE